MVAGATFGAGAGWNEAIGSRSLPAELTAADALEELLDVTASFEEPVLLVPHATKAIQHATQAAAAKIPTCLPQRPIVAMLPDLNYETSSDG